MSNAIENMPGMMVVVVGPSGVGKDSLLAIAREHFANRPDVHFVRRAITRPTDAGGEDHHAVSEAEFESILLGGGFAVHWHAHGLRYGIPKEATDWLAAGDLVIANGSRSVLPLFAATFSKLTVINITATPEVLAARLRARGRETEAEIGARLRRSEDVALPENLACITIDNSGALGDAGRRLIEVVEEVKEGFAR
ncbi:phosphonate metabolism protein/1,5-bisphosphokinase (PRPP-forming) PhnN [Rhizobium oryzicola]|uniref:Ribose 1,5-bisphosphate phosphokinase PhnN n=1 Tax=Rhizobium oryzicola TaxID=1232668 RepID=A0ABT8T0V7_9HYPH|nr:phosphonate metabolism protein/1,5-bisphosphokinase (PRPP-forming) PhnN [Rhizobium oryzicola]MDO1584150.1 phosphonate metabolism protein/1,5-bisphosphokinase (PRPP-forming) PhnN [Rhizobium oryzicola]